MWSLVGCDKSCGFSFHALRMKSKIPDMAYKALHGLATCLSGLIWGQAASYLILSSSVPADLKLFPASGGACTGSPHSAVHPDPRWDTSCSCLQGTTCSSLALPPCMPFPLSKRPFPPFFANSYYPWSLHINVGSSKGIPWLPVWTGLCFSFTLLSQFVCTG